MAELIIITGSPGTGKTFGIKTLPEDKTMYFNCDGKDLTFKGGQSRWTTEKGNCVDIPTLEILKDSITKFNTEDKYKKFDYLVIDTFTELQNRQVSKEGKKMTFNDWYEFAAKIVNFADAQYVKKLRCKYIFLLNHQQIYENKKVALLHGKAAHKMSGLEAKVNNAFYTKVSDGGEGKKIYELETVNDDMNEAKSYEDCFPPIIPNDYQYIVDQIELWKKS